jgi:choline dehydrogenase-like flavoprotein
MVDAKGDADLRAMRPAIASPTVRLMTGADVRAVRTEADGARVAHLDVRRNGRNLRVRAHRYVLAAGAVNTAALLLRSRDDRSPDGVANSSGMVGRNYMAHVSSFLVGGRPGKDPLVVYSKTVGLNDWYWGSDTSPYPLGNVQALGKIQGPTIKPQRPWVPLGVLEWASKRTVDFFVETEDVPLPENRVHVDSSGRIHLLWRQTNLGPHAELVKRMSKALRRAGYPLIFTQKLGIEATSHQVGTVRMGTDPTDSVVDPSCRAHDVENLWVVDGSVFPSSAAVNPALTIAANVLRVADTGTLAA